MQCSRVSCRPVIFYGKLEIRHCGSNEGCDDDEHAKRDKKNTIECVQFMPPNTRKYVVQFYVYSAEWQESCQNYLSSTQSCLGRVGGDGGRVIFAPGTVLGDNTE